jgi:PKD repeat protein
MTQLLRAVMIALLVTRFGAGFAQCTIDTTNTRTGFTPGTPAVVKPGIPYSQVVQVHVPATYSPYTVDSLHIDTITGMPSGITYVLNPVSGTVLGGQNGVICYSGTTYDSVGPYPLTFTGFAYTSGGPIPFSYLVTLAPNFGYKFKVETAPVAAFIADSPVCALADSVRFSDLSGGYPTGWAWTFPGGSPATSTHQYPVVYYDSAGTYIVTLAARNAISSDTITQTITVYPSLTGSVTTVPAIGDSTLTGSAYVNLVGGTPPYTYAWDNGATTDTMANVYQGEYWLTVTDAKGCQYIDNTVIISYVNSELNLNNGGQLSVFPNPVLDVIHLTWTQKSNAEIAILDISGNVIHSFVSEGVENNVYDLKDLASGTYLIRVTDRVTNNCQTLLFSKL